MLEIKNVMKEYGNKKILKGVNMSLDKGIYGLLGKNGAGKTTLFKIISGYTKKYSGSVSVGNDNSEEKSVGILPQNFQGYGELNVREFLKYVFKLKGLDKEQEYEIDEKIKIFSLEQHEKKLLKNLSGGQLRRVGLAQAFLGNPEVVLLDEPTAGLDPTERVKLKKYLAEVGEKCTILLSTHIVSDLEYISKKILILNDGVIAAEGSERELINEWKNKVWLCSFDSDIQMQEQLNGYTVSMVYNDMNKVVAKVICKNKPIINAEIGEASLNEVYLGVTGEGV